MDSNGGAVKEEHLGKVISPALINNQKGYRDSGRSPAGVVIATAANGIHIKAGQSQPSPEFPEGRGILFSVLPIELDSPSDVYQSYKSPSSSIGTDISAGTVLFAESAPFVGNKVELKKDGGFIPLPDKYSPLDSDTLVIEINPPKEKADEIVFENKFGGKVYVVRHGGDTSIVAAVYKPVMGIGRFDGSIYIGQSRVRANHHGVIDISVVPKSDKPFVNGQDMRGGFQIVPSLHAMAQEMLIARTSTQWMVVGPLSVTDEYIDGRPPLFEGYIKPGFKVECKIDNGLWEALPEMYGRRDTGLSPQDLQAYFNAKGEKREVVSGVTHIRILLHN